MHTCRCVLCGGNGYLNWEAKYSHKEPCPRCLGRRFINCRDCGGHVHRPIFAHTSRIRLQGEAFYGAPIRPVERSVKLGRTPAAATSRRSSGSGFSTRSLWSVVLSPTVPIVRISRAASIPDAAEGAAAPGPTSVTGSFWED